MMKIYAFLSCAVLSCFPESPTHNTMAKYVIAGKSDCPFYARIELLADELQQRLPHFAVHKIVVTPDNWSSWLDSTCKEKGWKYEGQSPLVWRELINRGGKGTLVGSANEFLEIAKGYYGITNDKITQELKMIAEENMKSKVLFDEQERKRTSCSKPFRITVTDAHSDLAYNLLPHLCSGEFKKEIKDIHLTLFSHARETEEERLKALAMELVDCAFPELRKVIVESDLTEAFSGSDIVIIVNSNEVNSETLQLLESYGKALKNIKSATKVLVTGIQPVVACNIILKYAGQEVDKNNVYAVTRLAENHAKAAIAKKLSVNTPDVGGIVVWGSSLEFVLDHQNSKASKYNGAVWGPHIDTFSHNVNEMVYDKSWLNTELAQVLNVYKNVDSIAKVEGTEGGDGIEGSQTDSSRKFNLSHSGAVMSQLKSLLDPAGTSGMFSLGISSAGGFCDIPDGLVFSVPCYCSYGKVYLKKDVPLDSATKERVATAASNLQAFCNELIKVS